MSARQTRSRRQTLRRLARLVATLLAVLAIWPALLLLEIHRYAGVRDRSPADGAVVLGAAAWHKRPSPVFAERIRHGISLYRKGRVKGLIFTGGKGRGAPYAEATVARRFALRRGVPAAHIHCETASHTTRENLIEARRITRHLGWQRLLIVSDPLHMRRAIAIARDLGLNAHPSPTPTSRFRSRQSRWRFLARETWFLAGYRLRHALGR